VGKWGIWNVSKELKIMHQNEIKKLIFEIINTECCSKDSYSGQTGAVFQGIQNKFRNTVAGFDVAQTTLTVWNDLIRTGVIAWGTDFNNSEPPFFHVTDKGRKALANISRDPSNPDGYLNFLEKNVNLSATTKSYLLEALETYNSNNYKASAVMVGCASESIVIEIVGMLVKKYAELGVPPNKKLSDWKIKVVLTELRSIFQSQKNKMPHELFEQLDSNWSAFTYQIRQVRNDAGHPENIGNITEDKVHAALLIFPELASLANKLCDYIMEMT
jgi:hypothetical protein